MTRHKSTSTADLRRSDVDSSVRNRSCENPFASPSDIDGRLESTSLRDRRLRNLQAAPTLAHCRRALCLLQGAHAYLLLLRAGWVVDGRLISPGMALAYGIVTFVSTICCFAVYSHVESTSRALPRALTALVPYVGILTAIHAMLVASSIVDGSGVRVLSLGELLTAGRQSARLAGDLFLDEAVDD
jgi:hypothetical protein